MPTKAALVLVMMIGSHAMAQTDATDNGGVTPGGDPPPNPVPEPATWVLMAGGLAATAAARAWSRRRKR